MSQWRLFEDESDSDQWPASPPITSDETTSGNGSRLSGGLIVGTAVLAVGVLLISLGKAPGSSPSAARDSDQLQARGADFSNRDRPERDWSESDFADRAAPERNAPRVDARAGRIAGDFGVKLLGSGTASDPQNSPTWEALQEKLADPSLVPARKPFTFYAVLFGVVVAAVLLIGFVVKLLRSTTFWLAVMIGLAVVAWYAWRTGHLAELLDRAPVSASSSYPTNSAAGAP